jgi:hypothetical protein
LREKKKMEIKADFGRGKIEKEKREERLQKKKNLR